MLPNSFIARRSWLGAPLIAGLLFGASLARAEGLRCVVELFTSQGCSSCPPADALLGKLARDGSVLAISFPVDYWDYIGWKDTLASPAFTARQKNYSLARGDGQVYTPQVVVDGLKHAVGSDADEINEVIAALGKRQGPLSVDMKVSEAADKIRIEVGAAAPGVPKTGGLWLLRIAKAVTVAIGRGENAGRTVTYTNVVRAITKVGEWNGAATSFEIPAGRTKGEDSNAYALVLQAGTSVAPGAILAAAKGANL